jgi:phage shock protein PspC (stress-responsive transcriptional regulator)
MGVSDMMRSLFGGSDEHVVSDPSLDQLREGYMVDYDLQTWEVATHASYVHDGHPADLWTLENGSDTLRLQHERDNGQEVFRLSEPVEVTDVTAGGQPLLGAVREGEPPRTVEYDGTVYDLAQEDTRVEETTASRSLTRSSTDRWIMGLWGGLAEYLGIDAVVLRFGYILAGVLLAWRAPVWLLALVLGYVVLALLMPTDPYNSSEDGAAASETVVSHSWRYESDDGFLALESHRSSGWDVYAGQEVEPYAFDNILPRASSDAQ